MVNYKNAKIYKIVCNESGLIYIGSTCKTRLCQRLNGHVRHFKMYKKKIEEKSKKKNSYISSFKVLERNNYSIFLLEEFPECKNDEQLRSLEGSWIKKINCVNKYIAGRTKKKYAEEHKEHLKEKNKEYREYNKEILKEKSKKYRELNKEKIKTKKKIESKKRLLVKFDCECGGIYSLSTKARHFKSKKHQNYISSMKLSNNTP